MADRAGAGDTKEGGCLCGAVRYRLSGPLRPVMACHCGQCRKTSGHYVAATAVARAGFELLQGAESLTGFESSPGVTRSFCSLCGSNLFWNNEALAHVSIMAGTLDQPSGLAISGHIYVADKGDYYELTDDLPKADER